MEEEKQWTNLDRVFETGLEPFDVKMTRADVIRDTSSAGGGRKECSSTREGREKERGEERTRLLQ